MLDFPSIPVPSTDPPPPCNALCCCGLGVCCPPRSPAWQRWAAHHMASKCCPQDEPTIRLAMPQFTVIAQNIAADSRYGFVPRSILALAHTGVNLTQLGYVATLLSNWDNGAFPPEHYAGVATGLISDPNIVLGPVALADAVSATFRPIVLALKRANEEVTF
jgi:hypothetical protein